MAFSAAAVVVGSVLADNPSRPAPPQADQPVDVAPRNSVEKRLDVLGVFDANRKPVENVELNIRLDRFESIKPTAMRSGTTQRALLPALTQKVVIDVESPASA
ncbi:MAG: hypothetical protein ACYTJ0_16295 [Planctomycetota bacterium]